MRNHIVEMFLEEGKKRVMTTRVLRRPRFSWLRRDYSDNDLRGVFFDRVFCVTRYEVWIGLESSQRTACFLAGLLGLCYTVWKVLLLLFQNSSCLGGLELGLRALQPSSRQQQSLEFITRFMRGAINTQIIFQSRVGVVVPSVRGSWRALLRVYQILKLLQVQFLWFFSLLGFHQFSAFFENWP